MLTARPEKQVTFDSFVGLILSAGVPNQSVSFAPVDRFLNKVRA
jgi:hypothetical protein